MAETIPFTQYLLPDGRKKPVSIEVPDLVAAQAGALIETGYRFECEVLTTGQISLTVFDTDEEEDIAIRVVPNGPGMKEAVVDLVADAARTAFAEQG